VLHHIVRGTHLGGLRGIAPRFEEYVFRPWLELPPEEIPPYLESHGQDWREDETNADTALTRNLLRHEVLPIIQQINPRAREHIARLAHAASDAHALFERELEKLNVNVLTATGLSLLFPVLRAPTGIYSLHYNPDGWDHPDLLTGYVTQHLAKQGLALTHAEHLALGEWSADPVDVLHVRDISAALPDPMCLVLQSAAGPDQQLAPLYLETPGTYGAGGITATLAPASAEEFQDYLAAPKTPLEQLTDWSAALPIAAASRDASVSWSCYLPATVKLPLILRNWQEGDRMTLTDGSTKKLGDIFTDAKVPRLFRADWAVLKDADGKVLWLPALADSQAMLFEPPAEPTWLITLTHSK